MVLYPGGGHAHVHMHAQTLLRMHAHTPAAWTKETRRAGQSYVTAAVC